MKIKFLFLFFSFCHLLSAQEPSHYTIGEEELAGVDIYGMIQGIDGSMWMCTSDALVRFNGYGFQWYDNVLMKSRSLFGITLDKKGEVYCANLVGQIFKVEDDSLKLHCQLPDTVIADMIHFQFDDLNRIVLSLKDYYVLESDCTLSLLLDSKRNISLPILKTEEEGLKFGYIDDKNIYSFKADKLKERRVQNLYDFTISGYEYFLEQNGIDYFDLQIAQ